MQKLDQDQDATPIVINQIRSVKVGRQGRSIPKAFEIFTSDKTYVLKAKDGKNAEEWVQCLKILIVINSRQNMRLPIYIHWKIY